MYQQHEITHYGQRKTRLLKKDTKPHMPYKIYMKIIQDDDIGENKDGAKKKLGHIHNASLNTNSQYLKFITLHYLILTVPRLPNRHIPPAPSPTVVGLPGAGALMPWLTPEGSPQRRDMFFFACCLGVGAC